MNLAEVFDEKEETEVEAETEESVDEQPEVEAETEDDSTVEDDATTTVAEQDESETESAQESEQMVPLAAQVAERKKRQELEAQLEELKKQLEGQKEEYQPPDPEEYVQRGEVQQTVTNAVTQAIFQERLSTHYEDTKAKYEDFPEMEAAFAEMAKADSKLRDAFIQAKNPAEFAYVQAKNAQLLQQYGGNIQAMLDAVKKEQSIETKETPEQKPKAKKAPSLANATESEKNSAPITKLTTLDDIFADYKL